MALFTFLQIFRPSSSNYYDLPLKQVQLIYLWSCREGLIVAALQGRLVVFMCVLRLSFLTYIKLHYLHILSHRWIFLSWDDLWWSQRGLKSHSFVVCIKFSMYSVESRPIWPIGTSFVLFEAWICRSDVPAPDIYALGGLTRTRTLLRWLRFSWLLAT